MTATLEQTQADLLRLIGVAQRGEEVVIVNHGQPVARLTALQPAPPTQPTRDRKAWLAKLARLRESTATGKPGPTVDEILAEDRGD